MEMKYKIGDIVNLDGHNDWIVLATKNHPLSKKYLSKLGNGYLKIEKIEKIAEVGVNVLPGFDYHIAKISSWKNGYAVLDEDTLMQPCFEGDIWQ
jgi:hypothetical protein